MGARLGQEMLCYVSVIILSSRRVDKLSRIMQIVDDGSGVIDCCIPYIRMDQTKPSPVQRTEDPRPKRHNTGEGTTKMSDYYPQNTKAPPRRSIAPTELPEWKSPFPVPDIGDTIRVEGKLRSKFEERVILVDKLGMCFSSTTEYCYLMLLPTYRTAFYEGRARALAASC